MQSSLNHSVHPVARGSAYSFSGEFEAFEELARICYDDDDLRAAADALDTALKLDPSRTASVQSFKDKLEKELKIEASWGRAVRDPFVVKYDDQKFKNVGEVVLGYLEDAEALARQTLGHVPSRRLTVVLYGRELSVALRYGRMIRRVAEEPEPRRLLEQGLGGPGAVFDLSAPHARVTAVGSELYGASKATVFEVAPKTTSCEPL